MSLSATAPAGGLRRSWGHAHPPVSRLRHSSSVVQISGGGSRSGPDEHTPAAARCSISGTHDQQQPTQQRASTAIGESRSQHRSRHALPPRRPRAISGPARALVELPSLQGAGQQRSSLHTKLAQCQADSSALISSMQSTFKSRFDRSDVLLQVLLSCCPSLLAPRCSSPCSLTLSHL